MGVETELTELRNRQDGNSFRVVERSNGQIEILVNGNLVVTTTTHPVTGRITLLAPGHGMTAALLGDSFTARNTTVSAPTRKLDWGYFNWAQALMGYPFDEVLNAGVAGERTDQILSRVQSVVGAYADWVFVQGGINDISASVSVSTIVENLKIICSTLANSGSNVVFLSLAPNSTAGYNIKVQQVNQAMREWCVSTAKGVTFIDSYKSLVNPVVTTGAFATGMSDDALHLSAKGARATGQAIATALSGLLPMRNFLPSSAAESYSVYSSCRQILDNPLMIGAGPAATGTGASGNAPTGYAASVSGSAASAVFSQEARSDGIGNNAKIVVSGAASGASVNIRQTGLVSRAAIGDTVYAVGQITISGASDVANINIPTSVTIDGQTTQINCMERPGNTAYDSGDVTLTFRSDDFTLTGASLTVVSFIASVTFGTSGSGSATILIGRCGLFKK